MNNQETFCISFSQLSRVLGNHTKHGDFIARTNGDCDLYKGFGSNNVLCLDRETCELVTADKQDVTLRSEMSGKMFRLSREEFAAAVL